MKALLQRFLGVSGGHRVISKQQAAAAQLDAQWQDPELPKKQYQIVENELKQIASTGRFPAHMQALVEQLQSVYTEGQSVLEIGCSSGYYSEVLRLAGLKINYAGCDYSPAFIEFAKRLYPQLPFQVCDATQLPYTDQQFDIAVSGCCILHILDYPKAVAETARVAKRYMVFSRTPILHSQATTYTKKMGYGLPMIEIFFNEASLIKQFRANGFGVLASTTISQGPKVQGESSYIKTYLCERLA